MKARRPSCLGLLLVCYCAYQVGGLCMRLCVPVCGVHILIPALESRVGRDELRGGHAAVGTSRDG
jgi:hypothetical protein